MSFRDYDVKQYEFIKRVEAAHSRLFDLHQQLDANGLKFDSDTYGEFIATQTELLKLATEMREHEMAKKSGDTRAEKETRSS